MAAKRYKKGTAKIADLTRHPDLQVRVLGSNTDHVEDLKRAIKAGKKLPVQVMQVADENTGNWTNYVTDGYHTLDAYESLGKKEVPTESAIGTWADALLAAASANAEHLGLKRSREDKRAAVELMLRHFPKWSGRRIAEHVQVSQDLVADVRGEAADDDAEEKTVEGRDGRQAKVKKKEKKPSRNPVPAAEAVYQSDLVAFLSATPRVWDALRAGGVNTVADVLGKHEKGEAPAGLRPEEWQAVVDETRGFVEPPAAGSKKAKQGEEGINWTAFHAAVGMIVREVNKVYKQHNAAGTAGQQQWEDRFMEAVNQFKEDFKTMTGKKAPAGHT